MKNVFKNTLKLMLICSVGLLTSCDAEKEMTKNNKLIMRPFSMNEVSKNGNSKLFETVNVVKNMHPDASIPNEHAKIVFEEKTGLYFDDEKGVYIEKGNIKSYTFPIIRTSLSEKVKNICFNEKDNGNFDVYIVSYDFTKEEAETLTKEQLIQREKTYLAIVKNGVPLTTFNYVCIDVILEVVVSEFEGVLDGNATEDHVEYVIIDSFCYDASGDDFGGFDYGFGSDSSGSNNSGGGESDSDIITGTIISDTEAQNPGSMPLGFALEYFENSLDEFSLPVYIQHPEFREYLASQECNYNSRQFIMEMIGVFQSDQYTQDQKDFLSQLLTICAYNSASFTINESVNSNNSTIEDIQNQLGDISSTDDNLFEVEDLPTSNNGFIGRCKLKVNSFYSVRVSMNFSTNPNGQYTLTKENVSSELSGLTPFTEWMQLPNQCKVNNNYNGKIKIELYGRLQQHYTVPPFQGIKITQFIRIIIMVDKNTGEIISSELYFD
jgi:hypothetical protein